MLPQNLARPSDFEPFGDGFPRLAARDWLRHRARKIEEFTRLTTAFAVGYRSLREAGRAAILVA